MEIKASDKSALTSGSSADSQYIEDTSLPEPLRRQSIHPAVISDI